MILIATDLDKKTDRQLLRIRAIDAFYLLFFLFPLALVLIFRTQFCSFFLENKDKNYSKIMHLSTEERLEIVFFRLHPLCPKLSFNVIAEYMKFSKQTMITWVKRYEES